MMASLLPTVAMASSMDNFQKKNTYGTEIYALYRAGILTGNDSYGTFTPDTNITRGAVATIDANGKITAVEWVDSETIMVDIDYSASCSEDDAYFYLVAESSSSYGKDYEEKMRMTSGSTVTLWITYGYHGGRSMDITLEDNGNLS